MEVDALLAKVSVLKGARCDGDEVGATFSGFLWRRISATGSGSLDRSYAEDSGPN